MERSDTQTEDGGHFYSSEFLRSAPGFIDMARTCSLATESLTGKPDVDGVNNPKSPEAGPIRIDRDQILFSFF